MGARAWTMKPILTAALLLLGPGDALLGGLSQSVSSPTDRASSEAETSSSTFTSAAPTHGISTDSPSTSPASSTFLFSSNLTANPEKVGLSSVSTAHSATQAPITGPSPSLSDSSRNDTATNGDSLGGSSTAKNLILVLLLVIAMVVLISLIVLRFKCRNYRKRRREAKDATSDKTTANKDQVILISIRTTNTDVGEPSSGKNDAVENGTIEERADI